MECNIFKEKEKNKLIESDPDEIITLGKYYPKHGKRFEEMDDFSNMVLDVKKDETELDIMSGEHYYYQKALNHFKDKIDFILSNTEGFMICVIPRHVKGTVPSGIRTIAKRLCSPLRIDGTGILSRAYEIPEKSKGGNRNLQEEIKSLSVKDEAMVKECQILLMDDLTTSGTSLRAGKILLKQAGAKSVAMLAIGETQKVEEE